jgi:pilus assembly protein Flp/PilA
MKKILARKKGQGLVEYALIIVLVAIVVIVALQLLGPIIGNVFTDISDALQAGGGGGGGGGGSGVITGANATYGLGQLTVSVAVSTSTNVSIGGSVSGGGPCSGSCQFTFPGAPGSGSATITAAAGGQTTVSW